VEFSTHSGEDSTEGDQLQYLGDATLAVAILDRVAMRAVRLDIDGPSYRQQVARDRAKQRGAKLPEDAPEPEDERER